MPRHFLDLHLDNAATVETDALSLTRRAIADIVRRRAMGVVHGPAGTGKTFAVEEAITGLSAPWQALSVTAPSRPTMRMVAAEIYRELTGSNVTRRFGRIELTELLRAELAVTPRLLVVDEAQNLSGE